MRFRLAALALIAFAVTAALLAPVVRAQIPDPGQLLSTLEAFYGTGVLGSASRINASSGNVAAATATATLPAIATKTNYLTGVDIDSGGATAAACVNLTITGLVGGTQTVPFCTVAGVAVQNARVQIRPPAPLPASAVNVAIVAALPSLGAGNTNAAVNAYGFAQ
jgi:hypothetical protein